MTTTTHTIEKLTVGNRYAKNGANVAKVGTPIVRWRVTRPDGTIVGVVATRAKALDLAAIDSDNR